MYLADVAQELITAANVLELDIVIRQELHCHREQHTACKNGCVASLLCCLSEMCSASPERCSKAIIETEDPEGEGENS